MFLSLFISVWVYLGYAVLNQPKLIVVLILIGGFFGSLFDPVSKALMGDMTPAEKRMRAFSLRYIGVNIGYAVGPLLGSILGITGNPLPFLIMSMVYFSYLLLLFILLHRFGISEVEKQSEETLSIQKIFNVIRSDSALLFLVLGSVLSTIVHGRWSVPLSLYLTKMENGDKLFSLLLSVNSATIIFLQPLIARKMERISPLFSIILGSVLLAAGELIFSITFIWWLFILAMIVFTIGERLNTS